MVFERSGFLESRIADITAQAGTATGSFYTYFDSKVEIFTAVVEAINAEMHHPVSLQVLASDGPGLLERIAGNHRSYLNAYRENARMMSVIEQVTNVSDDFRRARTAGAQDALRRSADAIRSLQKAGRADPDLDPVLTARALSVMVSRTAYVTFVLEEETGTESIEAMVETLTRLWARALGLALQTEPAGAPSQ